MPQDPGQPHFPQERESDSHRLLEEERQRDPIAQLPFWPPRADLGMQKAFGLGRKEERAVRHTANAAVAAVRACWAGDFKDAVIERQDVHKHSWDLATPLQKKLAMRIFHAAAQFCALPQPPPGEDAFRQVAGGPAVRGYTQIVDSSTPGFLKRGDLCPAVLSEISLPPVGSVPIDPSLFCPALKHYYEGAEQIILKNVHDVDHKRLKKIRTYTDPALKDPAVMMAFCVQCWQAGMLGTTAECLEEIDLFTVVKKDTPEGRSSRIVWDERKANIRCHQPPKMPLGSPSCFSHWDLSDEAAQLMTYTGDLPDWFYRLLSPPALLKLFVIPGISPRALKQQLVRLGLSVKGLDAEQQFLALRVLPMGFSWAPYFAHTATLALIEEALSAHHSRRLADGRPTPQLSEHRPVHWAFIDDYGVAVLAQHGADQAHGIEALAKEIRAAFLKRGVIPHKETMGAGLAENLGATIEAESLTLHMKHEKVRLVTEATWWAAQRETLSPRMLEKVVGGWTWFAMICRELLAVFQAVYQFIKAHPHDAEVPVWHSVRQELRVAASLAPLIACPLDQPWSSQVFMTDASLEGQGVTTREAELSKIKLEASLSERRGWVTTMDESFSALEYEEEAEEAEGGYDIADMTAFARPTVVILHLFSGQRRELDLEHYLVTKGAAAGFNVVCVSVDVQVDAKRGDLSSEQVVQYWLREIRARRVHGLHAGPLCSTWSRARFIWWCPGPRPVRSEQQPWGLPNLSTREQEAVDLGNLLLRVTITLALALVAAGGVFSIEHPEDPGPGFPSIWKLTEMLDLMMRAAAFTATFDQCMFGLAAKKGTTIKGNLPGLAAWHLRRCCHPRGAHKPLMGQDASGRFLTSYAQEYPSQLCEALATAFIDKLATQPLAGGLKVKVPPLSEDWCQPRDWRLLFASKWSLPEHNNVLETRCVVNLGRHLTRSSKNWNKRFLVMTDSMVALGALGKGRSSSPPLLRLCRRWATFRLVAQMRLYLRYVPTLLNVADGPSRGARIGAHPTEEKTQRSPRKRPEPERYRGQG